MSFELYEWSNDNDKNVHTKYWERYFERKLKRIATVQFYG